jgi:hypothetical protein
MKIAMKYNARAIQTLRLYALHLANPRLA